MRTSSFLAAAVALLAIGGFHPLIAADTPDPIVIFAAASTTESVQALAMAYEAEHHVTVTCSFASSSILAKQIEQGAPADLFLSADQKWMDYLAGKQAIVAISRVDLLANELVIIAPFGKPLRVVAEKGFPIGDAFAGRLAIGDPAHVPAGIYAQEAFTALGWWDALSTRLAPTADVRAALKLVELGEVDAGVVYATDAKASSKVTVAATIPARYHSPIRYPIALTATAKPAAVAFLTYLQSPAAQAEFVRAGFSMPVAKTVDDTVDAPDFP